MKFETPMAPDHLRILAALKGCKFQFLGGKSVSDLVSLDRLEVATDSNFIRIECDYVLPGGDIEEFRYFEIAQFEVYERSMREANDLMKAGWVFLQGHNQVIQDLLVARVHVENFSHEIETFQEVSGTDGFEYVDESSSGYELTTDQAILIQLETMLIALVFDHFEFFLFEVKFFDSLEDFRIEFESTSKPVPTGQEKKEIRLIKIEEICEGSRV